MAISNHLPLLLSSSKASKIYIESTISGEVLWLLPAVPALWEAKAGGALSSKFGVDLVTPQIRQSTGFSGFVSKELERGGLMGKALLTNNL